MWKCRQLGLTGLDCWWDAEEGYRYAKKDRQFSTAVVYVLVASVCAGVLWTAKELTDLPRNRGDLTVAEFSQNYNQFQRRFAELGLDNVPRLNQEGRWDEGEQDGARISHSGSASYSSSDGTIHTIENVVEGTTVWSQPEFTLADGRITAVTLRVESRDSIIGSTCGRETLALTAMSGAADGQDILHFEATDGLFQMLDLEYFEDAELDYWGLHISQRVDYEGYDVLGSSMWVTEEDAPCHFERTLTISLPEQ